MPVNIIYIVYPPIDRYTILIAEKIDLSFLLFKLSHFSITPQNTVTDTQINIDFPPKI